MVAASPSSPMDGSHALVIWAGDYRNPFWKKLNNLRSEAAQVEAALRRQGFQVTMVANPNAEELTAIP